MLSLHDKDMCAVRCDVTSISMQSNHEGSSLAQLAVMSLSGYVKSLSPTSLK